MFRKIAIAAFVTSLAVAACSGGSGDKLKIGGGFALTGTSRRSTCRRPTAPSSP